MERPQGGERPQQTSAETRQSLDRQAQARDTGAQRAQQYRSAGPSGFQGGGGGFRGGGGGGGRRR
jgi:hypothetical protein